MLLNIVIIILNIACFVVLHTAIYTDRALMPTGEVRKWRRSPADRLAIADNSFLYYLEIGLTVISVITIADFFLPMLSAKNPTAN